MDGLHDAHVMKYYANIVAKKFAGKTISQIKQSSIDYEKKVTAEFYAECPNMGDHVVFRSINHDGEVFDGSGIVVNMHVKDWRKKWALYTVKIDNGEDMYQMYANHPNANGEWIEKFK